MRESNSGTSTAWSKYIVSIFSFLYFSSVVSFIMYVSISSFLGMSRAETPSPAHSSKKGQVKCGLCHSFMSDLDPHPECSNCLPRSCCMGSPCPLCAPLSQDMWKKWELQQTVKSPLRPRRDPGGISKGGGGGNKAGKVYPAVPLYPQN